MTQASMRWEARLALGATLPVSEGIEFVDENLRAIKTVLDLGGLRGELAHSNDRTALGTYAVSGKLDLIPTPQELESLLPRILGGAPQLDVPTGATTYPLGTGVPEFFASIDRVARVFTYAGCKVVRATFAARKGESLRLSLDVEGRTETIEAAGTFPALGRSAGLPYQFTEGLLLLAAVSRPVHEIAVDIENAALLDRFVNSNTRIDIPIEDRRIHVRCAVPYIAEEAGLYDSAALAGSTLTFTSGNQSLTFRFGTLQFPAISPVARGKGEILLELTGTARKSNGVEELVVVNDQAA